MKKLLSLLLLRNKAGFNSPLPRKQPSLAMCILMDLLGYASFAIPFLGEFIDIAWAPISAAIFMRMFGGTRGLFGGIFNFIEELMPGLDFIPTFTITWLITYYRKSKNNRTIIIQPAH